MPLAVVLAAVIIVPAVVDVVHEDARRRRSHADRLAVLEAAGRDGAPAVALLGDSLLRQAVVDDEAMQVLLGARAAPAVVVKVSHSGRDWDAAANLERLVAARPKVLVVETDLLFYTPRDVPGQRLTSPATWSQVLVRAGQRLRRRLVAEGASTLDELQLDELKDRRSDWFAGTSPVLVTLLDRARAQGTQVVLLTIPCTDASAAARDAEEQRHIAAELPRLRDQHGFLVWIDPAPYDPDVFSDGRHMLAAGRARFSHWLADRVAARLGADAPATRPTLP